MKLKKGYGSIYMITSPTGKHYIGQVVDYLKKGILIRNAKVKNLQKLNLQWNKNFKWQ